MERERPVSRRQEKFTRIRRNIESDRFAHGFTARQGDVQRIFYVHLAVAWNAYLAFFVVFVASIAYLWRRAPWLDALARSSAEIGLLFTTLTLIVGSLWVTASLSPR